MNKMKWGLLGALVLGCLPAQAALIDRGNGLLYDDTLNITWLQDANYFKTQAASDGTLVSTIIGAVSTITDGLGSHALTVGDFDANSGCITWWGAQAWAQNLSYGGYTDWRLANITDTETQGCNFANSGTDCGYNAATATSELAHMYFNNLGLKSYLVLERKPIKPIFINML